MDYTVPMRVITSVDVLRQACDGARRDRPSALSQGGGGGAREAVGLVPTMGALHEGHATLVRAAKERTPFVVVTVFVNPTQFGPNEDLAKYPRTLEADVALATDAGASLVFAPPASEMYPPGDETRVRVPSTASALCGEFRPTHFEGVATVVTKLLAMTGPCTALFGRKDYQQLQVIRRLVRDLFLPVDVVGVPTVREPDGVALSSRNRYLSATQRVAARHIPEALSMAHAAHRAGERSVAALTSLVRDHVAKIADSVDYVTLAEPFSVAPLDAAASAPDVAVLALALKLGAARLIDNVVLGEDAAPIPGYAP